MEGYCQTLFGKSVCDFLLAGFVVPNGDGLVPRTSDHELLANTGIESGDLAFMEGSLLVFKTSLSGLVLEVGDVQRTLDHLSLASNYVDAGLLFI